VPDALIDLDVVIEGTAHTIRVNLNEPLGAAIAKALGQTGHSGRPPSEWVARTEAGDTLDHKSKLGDLGLSSRSRIFLSLTAGIGGSRG
jgi:uncharacterized protein DUF2604